jgi:hypothetical protein
VKPNRGNEDFLHWEDAGVVAAFHLRGISDGGQGLHRVVDLPVLVLDDLLATLDDVDVQTLVAVLSVAGESIEMSVWLLRTCLISSKSHTHVWGSDI